jgi:hypothetical protein
MAGQKKSFERWLAEVNNLIEQRTGLGYDYLPDCPYRDWYEAGVSPANAARKAIKRASE